MIRRVFILMIALSLGVMGRDAKEDIRIDALLRHLGSLEGAVFVRNGSDHSANDAVEHLRKKLKKAGERVKTAENFIDGCATKSSFSGKRYRIRFASGGEKETGPYLHQQLKRIDERGAD